LVIALAFFGGAFPMWFGFSSRVSFFIVVALVVIPSLIYFLFYFNTLGVSAKGMWPIGLAFQFIQSAFIAALGSGLASWIKHFTK
jgi:hypothetical protein